MFTPKKIDLESHIYIGCALYNYSQVYNSDKFENTDRKTRRWKFSLDKEEIKFLKGDKKFENM